MKKKLSGLFSLFLFFPLMVMADSFVIFTGAKDEGAANLFKWDLKTGKIEALTDAKTHQTQSAISPDGKKVAFISDQSGAPSLYLLDLGDPKAPWVNLSPGMGAYGHPAFSMDGTRIYAQYAPDPQQPLQKTQLVEVFMKERKQKVVLDSVKAFPTAGEERIMVVDRPLALSAETLVFIAIEYADPEAARVTSSGLWRLTLADGKTTHLMGGESYFDEKGKPHGFKATMPQKWGDLLSLVAIEGALDRIPMTVNRDGKDGKVIPVRDPDFTGPTFSLGKDLLYGMTDVDGHLKLAVKIAGEKERKLIPFPGQAFEPSVWITGP